MSGTSNRGFASMDAEKQREIASKGGKAAHLKGTAHQFTSEEARRAGSKGGRAARQKRSVGQQIPQAVNTPTNEKVTTNSSSEQDNQTRKMSSGVFDPRYSHESEMPRRHDQRDETSEAEIDEPLHRAS